MTPWWQRLAARVLAGRVSLAQQDEVIGDLAEDHAERRRSRGRIRASIWLAGELVALHRFYRRQDAGMPAADSRLPFHEVLIQDVRIGVRMLLKTPGFTMTALVTLALSIGANTVMFCVIDGALLRPLPYASPDALVSITSNNVERTLQGLNVSFTKLQQMEQQSAGLDSIGGYWTSSASLSTEGAPATVLAARVTRHFFDVFRVAPAAGRMFTDAEHQEGGADVALVTSSFWNARFGGDPSLVGRALRIDGASVTVVGILPDTFTFPFQDPAPDIWMPRAFSNPAFGPDRVRSGAAFLVAFGRRASGYSDDRVRAELTGISGAYTRQFPGYADASTIVEVTPLKESLVGPVQLSLLVLLAAVGLVLLMGCTNIASMLLARATTRATELAVRRALGASRGRLIRQLLTESLVLAFAGGIIGVLFAAFSLRLLSLLPPGLLPRLSEISLDGRVLAFSALICTVAGVGVGLLPALRASRVNIHETMKEGGRSAREGRQSRRARGVLVVAEVALAVVLVTSAGLLLKSFTALMRVEPGFSPAQVTAFSMALPASRYAEPARQSEFYRRLVEDVRALPGVESAAVTSFLPFGGIRLVYICPQGTVCRGIGKDPIAAVHQVTPDYFKTMGIPIVEGRGFTEHDVAGADGVAIVNASTANRFFPNHDAVGKSLLLTRGSIKTTIVGVIGDVRSRGPNNPVLDELFLPQSQSPVAAMSLVIQSAGPVAPLVAAVRQTVASIDPDLAFSNVSPMSDLLSATVAQPRLTAQLTSVFGLVALLLSTIGIYGVLAYTVSQRTHEIGLRLALGALRSDVLRLVLGQGLGLVGAGIVLGSALALGAGHVMASLLVGTSASDPYTFGGVAILLVIVALAASYLPARRASRVDPIVALRR